MPYLEEAVRLDSNYARAHAALASVYWDAWNNGWLKSLNIRSFRARKLVDDHRAEAGLDELSPKTIDLTRFGGIATQERVRSGLSVLPPPAWQTLLSYSESGRATVKGATVIDIGKAKALHDRGVRFIDARSEDDWFQGHIPKAFSLSVVRSSEARLTQIVDRLEEVVIYCNCPSEGSCNLSPYASAKAIAWGYQNVYYIKGAVDAWDSAGYPMEKRE